MFIIKGGISREIDERNLQEYIDKGYAPAGVKNEYIENENESIKTQKEKPKRTAKE